MRTDPADAKAIEASLEIAAERAGDLTPRVYALLFQRQPAMEAHFFRDDDRSLIKGEMLMRVLEALLDFIGERRYADHMIECEVITHEGYGCAQGGVSPPSSQLSPRWCARPAARPGPAPWRRLATHAGRPGELCGSP